MMLRILLFVLVAGTFSARASDPIAAPTAGASATVTQPHVTAELIPENTSVQAGQPFGMILHLHADAGWHTYWINPGDAGLATTIKWTLPPGFTAGPIQWPTPEKHDMGGLMTYGYGGDVYLLTTITPPKGDLPQQFDVKAKAAWLVCQEECIPGKAELIVTLDGGLLNLRLPQENKELFEQARARLPVPNTRWTITASYATPPTFPGKSASNQGLIILFNDKTNGEVSPGQARFFPEQANVLGTQDADNLAPLPFKGGFSLPIALQQNGDQPKKLTGVLVSDQPLIGDEKAVYISEFRVGGVIPTVSAIPPNQDATPSSPSDTAAATGAPALSGAPEATGSSTVAVDLRATGSDVDAAAGTVARRSTATTESTPEAQPLLMGVLGAAFVGGLILNLMPCVLPVLSLKVFSLMKHAGENAKAAWLQGVAFTVGVVISFWALAGLLIVLRTAGNHLGWGFQMQSPGFVLGLILLFFLLALNLFGVFELGSSLVGLDAKATGHLGGLASSFGNGALATVAATPCTAPFMGSALGFAAQQPAYISLLIFTFLALGMAAPYLLLTLFPGALRFVPKPGAWMEAFKQFMGFLLMATVIFLVYVFGALTGGDQVPWLLFVLLLAGLAAWIYGKWATPINSGGVRFTAYVLALGILGYAIFWGVSLANAQPEGTVAPSATATSEGWQPWTQDAVDAALAKGQPAFVDFTAAWCLSCKVNERVALDTDAVKNAFAQKDVALFRADWTHSDPAISQTLQKFNRDGVPLYLLYSPQAKDTPQVLPAVLTPGIVLDAVKGL